MYYRKRKFITQHTHKNTLEINSSKNYWSMQRNFSLPTDWLNIYRGRKKTSILAKVAEQMLFALVNAITLSWDDGEMLLYYYFIKDFQYKAKDW